MRLAIVATLLLCSSPALGMSSAGCTQHSPHRSAAAVREFRHEHPCPATGKTRGACPGYAIDHRAPLCCGGADTPANMRWMTAPDHKDRHAGGIVCEVSL